MKTVENLEGNSISPEETAQMEQYNKYILIFFKEICELLACSDPWAASLTTKELLKSRANMIAQKLGFSNWEKGYQQLLDKK